MTHAAPRFFIVAGEPSGDLLGAGLITALKHAYPHAIFEGIAGSQMQAAGCRSLFPLEALSVMGLAVIKHLPKILWIRHQLLRYLRDNPPDVYIGIDAPDFNLPVEYRMHQQGVKVVHYVSPSVWAWRRNRIKKIAKSVDLMLTLFPFEADFYTQHRVKAVFVGHPLADAIPLVEDQRAAREALQLPLDAPIVAILPGSRRDEIARLGPVFLQAAQQCVAAVPTLQFVVPMVNETRAAQFRALMQQPHGQSDDRADKKGATLPITMVVGQSSHAMVAADVILLASGTATLEAMLHKKPMVVAYKLSAIAYAIAKRLIKVKYIALPNLLSDQALVPELIQDQATAANISREVLALLSSISHYPHHTQFTHLHHQLQQNASEKAAQSVVDLLNG